MGIKHVDVLQVPGGRPAETVKRNSDACDASKWWQIKFKIFVAPGLKKIFAFKFKRLHTAELPC